MRPRASWWGHSYPSDEGHKPSFPPIGPGERVAEDSGEDLPPERGVVVRIAAILRGRLAFDACNVGSGIGMYSQAIAGRQVFGDVRVVDGECADVVGPFVATLRGIAPSGDSELATRPGTTVAPT